MCISELRVSQAKIGKALTTYTQMANEKPSLLVKGYFQVELSEKN